MRYLSITIAMLAVSIAMYAGDVGWVDLSDYDQRNYNLVATIALIAYMAYMAADLAALCAARYDRDDDDDESTHPINMSKSKGQQ